MTAALVVALLVIAAIAWVARPIGRGVTDLVEDDDGVNDAVQKKRIALAGILDLEEERDGGKLSDDEYRTLRARYEHDAVQALKEVDAGVGHPTLEARLEREIADARQKLSCTTCGTPRDADAPRCPSCGSSY